MPKHIHKYQRTSWGKNGTVVWKCVLEGCTHYLHREFIVGKVSLCHECGLDFIMSKEKLVRVKPRCDECIAGIVRSPGAKKIDDMLKDLI